MGCRRDASLLDARAGLRRVAAACVRRGISGRGGGGIGGCSTYWGGFPNVLAVEKATGWPVQLLGVTACDASSWRIAHTGPQRPGARTDRRGNWVRGGRSSGLPCGARGGCSSGTGTQLGAACSGGAEAKGGRQGHREMAETNQRHFRAGICPVTSSFLWSLSRFLLLSCGRPMLPATHPPTHPALVVAALQHPIACRLAFRLCACGLTLPCTRESRLPSPHPRSRDAT